MTLADIQMDLGMSDAVLAKKLCTIVDKGHPVDAAKFQITIDDVKKLEKIIRDNGNVIPASSKISESYAF